MFEKFLALCERAVVALESLVALASSPSAPAVASAAEPEKKPRGRRAAAETTAAPDTTGAASPPAPSVNAAAEPEAKAPTVTKDQVRALMENYGTVDNVAGALEITKQFATTNKNAKDQPYSGASIGTIDPLKYAEVAEALAKAIAAKIAAKAKAEANPLDD